ncbi:MULTISPECIES: hypothetical protein [unclassified Haladaptatus]|uniref:hypothetical protein n=1 Tax=unclassified Haladaptatus TaxID=2622732 RepID=UPI00209C0F0A|nr:MULTISPECIES: hypothetical protein [unclassified Haladaptatus]MCO8244108.1 hypothetical protein [Haladaptatus sp. AB643]MCO8255914.1 hypothetical protein [Haladaptatus sp. AB618]
MHRRRFILAGVAYTGAFAGCLGQSPDTSTSSTMSGSTAAGATDGTRTTAANSTTETTRNQGVTTTSSTSGTDRVVAVADAGSFETGGITGSLSLRKSKITDAHTAELVLSLRNRSSESVTLSYNRPRGLDLIIGTKSSGTARVLLVGGGTKWTRTDGCWQPDARVLERGVPDQERSITILGGETWNKTCHLWNHPENTSCLPRGTYEFARVFRRNDAKSTWRFSLSLS